jgi:hypothetical protein
LFGENYSYFSEWTHSWILNKYIGFILYSDFREILITGEIRPDNRSILLISNHFSWWDGFFAWYLNQKLFRKRFNIMMLEHELAKHMFFSRVGAFSIDQKSRGIIESLNFCSKILRQSSNMLVFYPQGKFSSQHQQEVTFKKGIERVLSQTLDTRVIFAAFLTDYYGYRKPTLTIALKEYHGIHTLSEMEKGFNEHLRQSVNNQDNLFVT